MVENRINSDTVDTFKVSYYLSHELLEMAQSPAELIKFTMATLVERALRFQENYYNKSEIEYLHTFVRVGLEDEVTQFNQIWRLVHDRHRSL